MHVVFQEVFNFLVRICVGLFVSGAFKVVSKADGLVYLCIIPGAGLPSNLLDAHVFVSLFENNVADTVLLIIRTTLVEIDVG